MQNRSLPALFCCCNFRIFLVKYPSIHPYHILGFIGRRFGIPLYLICQLRIFIYKMNTFCVIILVDEKKPRRVESFFQKCKEKTLNFWLIHMQSRFESTDYVWRNQSRFFTFKKTFFLGDGLQSCIKLLRQQYVSWDFTFHIL